MLVLAGRLFSCGIVEEDFQVVENEYPHLWRALPKLDPWRTYKITKALERIPHKVSIWWALLHIGFLGG